ncbi:MAG: hypothetical protein ACYDHY_17570 [Acidiferrobacterales bacterium]
MSRHDLAFVRVTRPDGSKLTLRLEHQLCYVLANIGQTAAEMASGTDVSPRVMANQRRRLRRIWEQEAGLPWPPVDDGWEVME